MTYTYSQPAREAGEDAEIGPAPYFHRSDCNMCRNQDGLKTGSELLDAPHPGGIIALEEHFLVVHAPLESSSSGTVIVESRRHLLDFAEMTQTELDAFGSLLHRLVPAVKSATGVDRVYYLALMERVGHFHMWLVPKKDIGDLKGADYLAQKPPLTATFDDAKAKSERIRGALEVPS